MSLYTMTLTKSQIPIFPSLHLSSAEEKGRVTGQKKGCCPNTPVLRYHFVSGLKIEKKGNVVKKKKIEEKEKDAFILVGYRRRKVKNYYLWLMPSPVTLQSCNFLNLGCSAYFILQPGIN